ncbi:MAG: hypothetical protein GY838_11060 [bacterium]|nr:hypothetical protein [bacterium]
MNNGPHPQDMEFECVEPAVGELLWQLRDPDLAADTRARFEDHLLVCDACRLEHAVSAQVSRLLEDGEVVVATRHRGPRLAAWSGGCALAAALVLAFLVPPRPATHTVPRRGVDATHVVRPVEGEVVLADRPHLDWTPVPGATAYRVEITGLDDDHHWRGRLATPPARLPAGAALPGHGRYRALIEPIPEDLALPGDLSVSFVRTGPLRFAAYRLTAAPPLVLALGGLGLFGLAGAALANRRRPA